MPLKTIMALAPPYSSDVIQSCSTIYPSKRMTCHEEVWASRGVLSENITAMHGRSHLRRKGYHHWQPICLLWAQFAAEEGFQTCMVNYFAGSLLDLWSGNSRRNQSRSDCPATI
ncbi:hypothetical protein K7X08_036784 [Anisodus acutangulus]|uniref:Uncharacterized protein n=1 Tax=Anisodus acutangulus TaxID=402998 RepID=A0A9Q1LAA7_9SOLA|nr:hypothetical protein K7X08_036784 [Anisodus acutangulus]